MAATDRPVISSILYREDGTALLVGDKGELATADFAELIARGQLTGAAGLTMGYVATSATTIVAVRGTTYTEPASASQMELVSSSTQDDDTPGGTGTRSVRLTYYDGSMNGPNTEDVALNGTSAVATVATNIRFVESIRSLTVGSNGSNVGTITLRVVSGGATVGTIAVSDGVTFWAHHYVAPGRVCFLRTLLAGNNGVSAGMFFRKARPLTTNAFEEQISPSFRVITAQPSQAYDLLKGLYVPGPVRVTLYVRPDANTANTSHGGFAFADV